MARFLKFRKSAVLPDRAPGGQVRLYLKPDETLETVDDEGNRVPVGDGEGGGSGIPQGGPLTEPLDADSNKITGLADPDDPQDAATKAYVLANAAVALVDPGNVWEAETAVAQGYRIIGGVDEEKVFESSEGTTGTEEPDFDDVVPGENTAQDGEVFWLFIGYVEKLPFSFFNRAEFVANGSTVDQLRDALIAAGFMRAS